MAEQCLAALRILPEHSLASDGTAAALYGFAPVTRQDIDILLPPGVRHDRLAGVRLHSGRPADPVYLYGVPCTPSVRTVLHIAARSGREHAVMVLDAAGRLDPDVLAAAQIVPPRDLPRRGCRLAHERSNLATGLAESALESLAMLLWHDCGLPAPEQQAVIRVGGRFCGRVDFLWRTARLIVEVDGLAKYAESGELQREKERQNRLVAAGYTILRFTWADITQRPDQTAAQVRRALRAGAAAARAAAR